MTSHSSETYHRSPFEEFNLHLFEVSNRNYVLKIQKLSVFTIIRYHWQLCENISHYPLCICNTLKHLQFYIVTIVETVLAYMLKISANLSTLMEDSSGVSTTLSQVGSRPDHGSSFNGMFSVEKLSLKFKLLALVQLE